MKAYLIEKHIELSELPLAFTSNAPDPVATSNDVLIDVYTAAFNFFDLLQVAGKYQVKPAHPYVAGCEFSGVISKDSPIPKGCTFIPGKTRVFGATQGAYAEKCKADYRTVIEVPEGMSFDAAAGLFITYPTSYAALVNRANIQPGEFLLIHACAGGVGLAALQIGKALGAIVIATASTKHKLDICKKYGADYVLNYSDENKGGEVGGWQKKVMEITKGKGVNVVYDPVGMIIPSLKVIAWNGRIVVVGFAGGNIEKVPSNLILLKNISVVGVHWGAYTRNEPAQIQVVWSALLAMFAQKKIQGIVYDDKIFKGLETVPEGLKWLGERGSWGKMVCRVREDGRNEEKL